MLIVMGVIGMWLFQIFENIGMDCGLMPITGIRCPSSVRLLVHGRELRAHRAHRLGVLPYVMQSALPGLPSRKEGLMNPPRYPPPLLKAATDIDEARNTPLAVSVSSTDGPGRWWGQCAAPLRARGQDPGDHRVSG